MRNARSASRGTGSHTAVGLLRALWKRYEHHCTQTDSCPCKLLKEDIFLQIEKQQTLKKITLSFPDYTPSDSVLPSLQPLLMALRDERYTHVEELNIRKLSLEQKDIVELCLLLERGGRTVYPIRLLELVDCKHSDWYLERLGKAVKSSFITTLCLDYTHMSEGLKGLLRGGLGASQIRSLSLCYCGLGSWSGTVLASLFTKSSVRELFINGNELQCVGATELLRPLALNSQKRAETLNMTISNTGKKTRKRRAKTESRPEVKGRPWLKKLHMFDNSIDDQVPSQLKLFMELICILVKFSSDLTELDLGENHIGEAGGKELLEALKERKAAKLSAIKIQVSTRMSTETFSAVLKNSKKLKSGKRKQQKTGKMK
ncbi:uncharacterized protein LOC130435488 isoform X2 [Triplophysa dalaica]|uniref:uncharacterized protein LOC130435488 isoform X2 n=1 Tax=Triplophysa dalaica TaxID=1582913 RepID=UPI0024DFED8A|nr:uncharacterized protein LOC130435488 isoform X2 [Triplophysa dalaica]